MLYFIITLFLFSMLEVASKPLMIFADPVILTFHRFSFGLLTLLIFAWKTKKINELRAVCVNDLKILMLLGIINTALGMPLLQIAVKYANAATAAVIFCSNPFFVFIFSVLLGNEKFSYRSFFGVLSGIAGVFLVMWHHGIIFSHGTLFALLASMLFAAYIVLNKKVVASVTPLAVNIIAFFFGQAALFIYLIISKKGIFLPDGFYSSLNNVLIMAFLGIAITGIGYITFINTIKRYSPLSASVIFLLKPALATIFALILLAERPGEYFYYGLFMVMFGSWLILSAKYYKKV